MDRRELLRMGAASLAAAACARADRMALAQAVVVVPPARTAQFELDVFSRDLQWLRTPPEVAQAVIDIGLKSIDLTVMPFPGHVDPATVKKDLPAFVSGLKEHGVTVSAITCPITDADSPNAEAILDAACSAGIGYFSWGGLKYDESRPYPAQLDALKPRVEKLAKLSEKCRMKGLYQPQQGAGNVGAAFFDLLDVLRNFDPRHIAFRYDTGNMLQATPDTMVTQLRIGAPYIGGVALNDAVVKIELPTWNQGPYSDNPNTLGYGDGGGDNTGRDGGDPLAIGGGGRPLPYHFHLVPVGMGMINLELIGKVLKEVNFDGPAECQSDYWLGGAELGDDKITLPRQAVLGKIKHNRLMIDQAFAPVWGIPIAQPAFMKKNSSGESGNQGPARGAGRGPGL